MPVILDTAMWLTELKNLLISSLIVALSASGYAREFSVMTYNLHQFALADRDHDGREDDAKPDHECRALARVIASARPDVLAVQEIGGSSFLNALQAWLKTEGVNYAHVEMLQRGNRKNNLAVLSMFPIIGTTHHTNEWYTIGQARLAVARGFLETEIQVTENYSFHLINAHLKSKVYNRLGQTEMRRNEARLLNKTVRGILKENPGCKLIVAGDMNDNPNSAAIREVTGKSRKNLFDLRPAEAGGDAWTYYEASAELHTRFDYIFSNAEMLGDAIPEKSTVIRNPLTYEASDHRPILVTFKTD
ncbi:endonuclease/exonuclease/phosphatase family protein [Pontiellaceae bacterium B12219]|nr:endonuclease/exonuclease/phosphatase family protein [Pontiellaceae bacterium B12219]